MISSKNSSDCARKSLKIIFSGLLFCLVLGTASSAFAQSWAENLFGIKSHDFGSVPLKSDTRYSFKFRNTTKYDIHVASESSSCSCTDVIVPKKLIRPGETGEIIAKVNTSGQHLRKKGATITVQFDRPSTAFVQLEISVYIRPDVVLDPGLVDFGSVREGKSITRTVQLHYAGDPNWELKRIDRANNNPFISAKAIPLNTQGNTREVSYTIQITISDKAPPGYFREILRFVTNENAVDSQGRSSSIELPVSGLIMGALVAKPSPFQFGSVAPGKTVTKYLVLRASQPFRVMSVICPEDRRFIFFQSDQSSSIQIVAVSLSSRQNEAETIARTIYVKTNLKGQETLKVRVYARFLTNEDISHEYYAPLWKDHILGKLRSAAENEDADRTANSQRKDVNVPAPKYLNLHTQPDSSDPSTDQQTDDDIADDDIFVDNEQFVHPRILRHNVSDQLDEELVGNEQTGDGQDDNANGLQNDEEKNLKSQSEIPYSSSLPLPKKLSSLPVKKQTQPLSSETSEPIVSRRTPSKRVPRWSSETPQNEQSSQEDQILQEQDGSEEDLNFTPANEVDSDVQDDWENDTQNWIPANDSNDSTEQPQENNVFEENEENKDSGNNNESAEISFNSPIQVDPLNSEIENKSYMGPLSAKKASSELSGGVLFDVPKVLLHHTTSETPVPATPSAAAVPKTVTKSHLEKVKHVSKPAPQRNQTPSKPIVSSPVWTKANR